MEALNWIQPNKAVQKKKSLAASLRLYSQFEQQVEHGTLASHPLHIFIFPDGCHGEIHPVFTQDDFHR